MGPEGTDFGSLHAFLGGGPGGGGAASATLLQPPGPQQKAAPGAPAPAPCAPKKPPKPAAAKDGTQLNKKVAFKMLRQLGCQVQRTEGRDGAEGEPYIQVTEEEQPVLFRMLLDFGYGPAWEGGQRKISVFDKVVRSKEEVLTSLMRPKTEVTEMEFLDGEGWPVATSKPTMSSQEAKDMVQRLVAPRPNKAEQATKEPAPEPPKFRSRADQEASLDRLLRKKTPAPSDFMPPPPPAPASQPPAAARAASEGAASRRPPRATASGAPVRSAGSSRPPLAPPVPQSSPAGAGSTWPASSGSREPVRPSPRLAQAGYAALTGGSASPSRSGALPQAACDGARPASGEGRPTGDFLGKIKDRLLDPTEASSDGQDQPAGHRPPDWLESFLGPAPAPAPPKTKAELKAVRERLAKLAEPRKKPEPEAPPEGLPPKQRTAAEQREYLSRLAEPRTKKPAVARDSQEPAEADEQESPAIPEEAELDEEHVVVIPSLLARCRELPPIDEERSMRGSAPPSEHGSPKALPSRRRARSVPAGAATPYSVPVVKDLRLPRPYRASAPRPGRAIPVPPPCREQAQAPAGKPQGEEWDEEGGEGEALLEDIDRLYGALLEGQAGPPAHGDAGGDEREWDNLPAARASCSTMPRTEEDMERLSRELFESPDQDEDDEQAVADMAHLYNEMLRGTDAGDTEAAEEELRRRYGGLLQDEGDEDEGQDADDPSTRKAAADIDRLYGALLQGSGAGTPSSAASGCWDAAPGPRPKAATPEELRELLEEVLWSAMLTGRGAGSHAAVQAQLLELLSPQVLAAVVRACGPGGLKPSLAQRLSTELPLVHAAVTAPAKPQRGRLAVAGPEELAEMVRKARDELLNAASDKDLSAEAMATSAAPAGSDAPGAMSGTASTTGSSLGGFSADGARKGSKSRRRSSMSFWTEDALSSVK